MENCFFRFLLVSLAYLTRHVPKQYLEEKRLKGTAEEA